MALGLVLSPEKTVFITASVSAFVSFATTFLAIRFGPGRRIVQLNAAVENLRATLEGLVREQSRVAEVEERRFQEERTAQWKPDVYIEDTESEAFLMLKSDREFSLHRITLRTTNGGVADVLPLDSHVASTVARIPLPPASIKKLCDYIGIPFEKRCAEAVIGYELTTTDDHKAWSLLHKVTLKGQLRGSGGYLQIIG